jgi:N-acetylglucosamine-6-sulfatase
VEYADGEREYYDLATDPYELDNTIGTVGAGRIAELHARLLTLEQCHDQPGCAAGPGS